MVISTIKYLKGITFLHFLHFPFKNKKEIKGRLSNQFIFFLHLGQNDRPLIICLFFGKRYMQTFEKLPKHAPKIKIKNEFKKIK